MEILSIETKAEADNIINVLKNSTLLDGEIIFHVGGISLTPRSTSDWYWVNSGKKLDFTLKFVPGQPDFAHGIENCLSINKYGNEFGFNDIPCFGHWDRKFICQRDDFL